MESKVIQEAVKLAEVKKNQTINEIKKSLDKFNEETGLCLMGTLTVEKISGAKFSHQGAIDLEIVI